MSDPDPFLRVFFGDGNRSSRGRQSSWVEMLHRGREVVLPRMLSPSDAQLYCLAPSVEALERLLGIVRANLGSRWVRGDGSPGWDARDAFDAQLARHASGVYEGGALVVRRLPLEPEHIRSAARALERLAGLLRDAPGKSSCDEQGLAALLREVRVGVAAGIHGRHDVDRALHALLEQGHLAAINVDFLRTWAWAEMGRYRELLEDGACARAQQFSRRPRMVTAAIAKAAWAVYLVGVGSARSLGEALTCYRTVVEPRFSAVLEAFRAQDGWLADAYRVLHGLAFDDALLYRPAAEALAAATEAPPDFLSCLREELARRAPPARETPLPPSSAELVALALYDAAVECLRHQAPSVEGTRLLWTCAAYVDSAYVVLEAWHEEMGAALEARVREAIPGLARMWDRPLVQGPSGPSSTTGAPVADVVPAQTWLEWLERACDGRPDCDLRDLPFTPASVGTRALVPSTIDADEAAEKFCERLGATFTSRIDGKVQLALPEMVGAWNQWDAPDKFKSKVADAITFYAAASELLTGWGPAQFTAYSDMLDARLAMGADRGAYQAAVESLASLVGAQASRQSVERAIECAEILADQTCADSKAREEFLSRLAGRAAAMLHMLDRAAQLTLDAVCTSLGLLGLRLPYAVPARGWTTEVAEGAVGLSTTNARGAAVRRRIGAYTLEEASGRRFKALAEKQYPVEVVLNHDHVETTALRELRKLEVVIVVTRRAKHAATDAIERYVDKDRIVYAKGGGSSSMLRELASFLDSAA